jgi:hypothetical protein
MLCCCKTVAKHHLISQLQSDLRVVTYDSMMMMKETSPPLIFQRPLRSQAHFVPWRTRTFNSSLMQRKRTFYTEASPVRCTCPWTL